MSADFTDYIMSAEEYSTTHHTTPYVFHLRKGERQIFYFGARHSNDPGNAMYVQLKEHLDGFEPDLVCVEGNPRVNTIPAAELKSIVAGKTVEQAIMQNGESGFALYEAVTQGVPVCSPEPMDRDLMAAVLQQGFSKDDIFAYWTVNVLAQWHRLQSQPPYAEYLNRFYTRWAEDFGWLDYDFSFKHYKDIHKRIFDTDFTPELANFFVRASDPIPWPDKAPHGVTNKVAKATSKYRDAYMVNQLYTWFNGGKRKIFVVFGASHAVFQEPALRKMFEDFAEAV